MTFTRHSFMRLIVIPASLLFVCGFIPNAPAAPDVPASSADVIIDGQQAYECFGNAVAFIGDVDGDGCDDFAVGAPGFDIGIDQYNAGRVDAYSGRTGEVIWSVVGTPAPPDIFLDHGDMLGWSLAPIGDLDGDGVGDVVIGAPGTIEIDNNEHVYIHSGASGQRIATLAVGSGFGGGIDFGWSVSSAGDVTGDGLDDILAGAPLYIGGGALIHTFEGQASGDAMGRNMAGGSDLDGDGVPDFALFAEGEQIGVHIGVTHIFSGNTLLEVFTVPTPGAGDGIALIDDLNDDGVVDLAISGIIGAKAEVFSLVSGAILTSALPPQPTPNGFALQVSPLWDLDGDGDPDLAVAAPHDDTLSFMAGSLCLYSTATGALLKTITADWPNVNFGHALASGDANGDGIDDLLVGARFSYTPGAQTGRVLLFLGGPPCQGDFDFSGVVNGADLATLLSQWGQASAAADLNADGVVNGADLAQLLTNWGACT